MTPRGRVSTGTTNTRGRNSDGSESWVGRRAALSAILESSLDVLAAGRNSRDGRKRFGKEGVGKGEARF